MVAYRSRCLALIHAVQESLMLQGLKLPPAPGPTLKPIKMAPVVPSLQIAAASARLPLGPLPLEGALIAPRQQQQQRYMRRVQTSPAAAGDGYGMMAAASASAATAAAAAGVPGSLPRASPSAAVGAGTAAAMPRSSSSSWRGPLAFLPGGKAKEELVVLQVQVLGYNLHMAKYISLRVFGEEFLPVDVNNLGAAAASSSSSDGQRRPAASASTSTAGSNGLGGAFAQLPAVSYILRGFQQAGVALSRAADNGRPAWKAPVDVASELTLQVQLPKSVVAKLSKRASLGEGAMGSLSTAAAANAAAAVGSKRASNAAAAAAARPVAGGSPAGTTSSRRESAAPMSTSQAIPATGASAAAGDQEDQSGLVLLLRSDFEVAKIEVQVLPYKVGVIGSSREAALLMQALLSGAVELQPALAVAAEEAAARGVAAAGAKRGAEGGAREAVAGAAASAAKLLSSTTGRWWSAGVKWAQHQQQQQKQLPGVPTKGDSEDVVQRASTPSQVAVVAAASVPDPVAAAAELPIASEEGAVDQPTAIPLPPISSAAAAASGDQVTPLQPLWVEPWVPVSYAAQDPEFKELIAAPEQLPRLPQQQELQQQQVQKQQQQQEEVRATELLPRSKSEPLLQRLSSLKSSASAVPALAAARAVQAVNAATARVKQLQRPAAAAVSMTAEEPARKRLRIDYTTAAAGIATPPPAAATRQQGESARVRLGSSRASVTGVSNAADRSSRGSRSPAAGITPSSGAAGTSSNSGGSGISATVRSRLRSGRPPLPSTGLKRRGSLSPAGAPRLKGAGGGVGDVQPRAAAVSDVVLSADMEVDGVEAEQQRAVGLSAEVVSPADTVMVFSTIRESQQQQQQQQRLEAGQAGIAGGLQEQSEQERHPTEDGKGIGGREEQGLAQVASNLQSWVAQQVGAAVVALQQQQQQRQQQDGTAGPDLFQRALASMGRGAAADAASGSAAAGPPTQKGFNTRGRTRDRDLPSAGLWPSAVLYQTLPAPGPSSAKPRRAWLPTCKTTSSAPSSSNSGSSSSSGSNPSLQQVLRLTSRQLLRNQASSWSLPEVATWGPAAARGALGVMWSSVYQRSWQPARDAWSAWKGGLASGSRGHGAAAAATAGRIHGAEASTSAGGSAGGVCAPDGRVCVQGSKHVEMPSARGTAAAGPSKGLLGRLGGAHHAPGASIATGAGAWDVLLVAVTWDGSFPGFTQEPALGPMVNAAQSAGVPILPVLLVEGQESMLGSGSSSNGAGRHRRRQQQLETGSTAPEWMWGLGSSSQGHVGGDKLLGRRSLGLQEGSKAQHGFHGKDGKQEEPKVWRLEEGPKQLAEALGVPVSRVCVVQVPPGVGAAAADPGCLSHVPGEQQWQLYEELQHVRGAVRLLLQELYGRQAAPPRKARL